MVQARSEHIVSSYEEELTHLTRHITEMGGMVEQAISEATSALVRVDHDLAQIVIQNDKDIDDKQRGLDEMAVSMIARRQPMASDLRRIVASIHVATDLERIGDMAKSIARRTLQISDQHISPQLYSGVRHMSDMVLTQVSAALQNVTALEIDDAIRICEKDEEVDALYMSLFREFLTYMMEDPRNITDCTHLLFCAKNLERAGDHATNIVEAAFYIQTGENLIDEIELRRDRA
ncbi:MAG: phosphate signaling complex protein PhoU [Hyphomicrobiaceae bacterium]|nr:phosphate signaling complex protein PhoU [Hyphomicrobiaceae bacterium]MCC0022635.1 phosphate signaling complex protein PhoU [Hyphomicrobiaceae bacterium]